MNALLIYPEFPDTFWSFQHALKFIRKKAALPPLGLLTVAAMLLSEWAKRLVDINVTRLTPEDLAWADCAFISAMSVQRESARKIIGQCKAAGVTVVAGGPAGLAALPGALSFHLPSGHRGQGTDMLLAPVAVDARVSPQVFPAGYRSGDQRLSLPQSLLITHRLDEGGS